MTTSPERLRKATTLPYKSSLILTRHKAIFIPSSPAEALSGPNMGWVPRMDTVSGKAAFIQRTGISLTEQTSATNASGLINGAAAASTSLKDDIGMQGMTIRWLQTS